MGGSRGLVLACVAVACRWRFEPDLGHGSDAGDAPPDAAGPLFAETFEDGDYMLEPIGVVTTQCNPGNCGTFAADIVTDAEGSWVRLVRTGSPRDGGSQRLTYDGLARPAGSQLRLRYRVRPILDELNNGGDICIEWGAEVKLYLTLTDSSAVMLSYPHNYGVAGCLPDATWFYAAVAHSTWTEVEHDVAQHLAWLGLAPAAIVDAVVLGGSGWDFESHFDDVVIY